MPLPTIPEETPSTSAARPVVCLHTVAPLIPEFSALFVEAGLTNCRYAPFRRVILRDGRYRQESFGALFLRVTKDGNQVVVDKT